MSLPVSQMKTSHLLNHIADLIAEGDVVSTEERCELRNRADRLVSLESSGHPVATSANACRDVFEEERKMNP
jgi:ribosomal protein L17